MKRALFKFIKGLSALICVAAVVIFLIYSIAWYTFAKRAEIYMDAIWQDKTLTIAGEKPHYTGYPIIPKAQFSGSIEQQDGFKFSTPEIILTGYPAVRQIQMIEAPKGLRISSNYLEQDLNLDYGFIQFVVPASIPYSDKKIDMETWQKSDDPIIVQQIILKAGSVYARGSGTISLDENLQLSADITARIMGMDSLLDNIAKEKGEKTVGIARSYLNMMTQLDEKTGEKYFETSLKIQKRAIYFGPMRIAGLPELKWKE